MGWKIIILEVQNSKDKKEERENFAQGTNQQEEPHVVSPLRNVPFKDDIFPLPSLQLSNSLASTLKG